jgi:GDP-L-fucose synthase
MNNFSNEYLVTGGSGLLGSALKKLIPDGIFISSKDYDLRNQNQVKHMFNLYKPKNVLHLAARVGGVKVNSNNNADFYTDNIMINTNVIEQARIHNVKKVVSLLSTCIYPDVCTYPLTEEQIHNGPPHNSNYGYAYSKRMLEVQTRAYRQQYGSNFISVIPNNLFGEDDNFDLENSHVIPAIIRKMYEAKNNNTDVLLWGDGSALREFTYSQDIAKILILLCNTYDLSQPLNIGNTNQFTIKEIAEKIAIILNFDKNIIWDTSQPTGQLKKPSSNEKFKNLYNNFKYTNFDLALTNTIKWFINKYPNVRGIN